MTIKNKEDARAIQSAVIKLSGNEAAKEFVDDLKASLRKFYHKPANNGDSIIVDKGFGYYAELEPVPADVAEEELEGWFDAERRLVYFPSQYDCTGQHFTTGHHFTTFRGRTYLVHNVAIDC